MAEYYDVNETYKIVKKEVRCNMSFNRFLALMNKIQVDEKDFFLVGDRVNWLCNLKACRGRERHWVITKGSTE